jgi:hypothetical protein
MSIALFVRPRPLRRSFVEQNFQFNCAGQRRALPTLRDVFKSRPKEPLNFVVGSFSVTVYRSVDFPRRAILLQVLRLSL